MPSQGLDNFFPRVLRRWRTNHKSAGEDNDKEWKPSHKPFVHEPLDLSSRTIRVVKILPGIDADIIQCSLEHVTLQDDSYACLSYMWGANSEQLEIQINGGNLSIRRNLHDFMLLARRLKISEPLWIDAISIDQLNIQECNHQVELMAEIYAKAKRLIIWPGKIPNDLNAIIGRIPPLFNDSDGIKRLAHDIVAHTAEGLAGKTAYDTIAEQCLSKHLFTFTCLLGSPYWDRLWILQEILLAKTRFVLVGDQFVPWIQFVLLLERIRTLQKVWSWAAPNRKRPRIDMRGGLFAITWFFIHNILQDGYLGSRRDLKLSTTLHLCRMRSCERIQDRWYGCMGITRGGMDFTVNYEQPTTEVFINVIQHLRAKDTLDDLSRNISLLAEVLELRLLTLCYDCANVHPQVETKLDSSSKAWLFVALHTPEAFMLWNSIYERDQKVDFYKCAGCGVDIIQLLYAYESWNFTRAADNALWCIQ